MFDNLDQNKTEDNNNQSSMPPQAPIAKPTSSDSQDTAPNISDSSDKVDDIFSNVESQADYSNSNIAPEKKISPTGDSGHADNIIRVLIFVIIMLLIVIVGLLVANRFLGFWTFKGMDFLNKPEAMIEVDNTKTMKDTEVDDNNQENSGEDAMTDSNNEADSVVDDSSAMTIIEDDLSGEEMIVEDDNGASDAQLDTDNDGLTDAEEITLGTDVNNKDTDGDGLFDGDEYLEYSSNPFEADSDGDGLPDSEEVLKYKTSPTNPDTDGDGYSDMEEIDNGYDPLS